MQIGKGSRYQHGKHCLVISVAYGEGQRVVSPGIEGDGREQPRRGFHIPVGGERRTQDGRGDRFRLTGPGVIRDHHLCDSDIGNRAPLRQRDRQLAHHIAALVVLDVAGTRERVTLKIDRLRCRAYAIRQVADRLPGSVESLVAIPVSVCVRPEREVERSTDHPAAAPGVGQFPHLEAQGERRGRRLRDIHVHEG